MRDLSLDCLRSAFYSDLSMDSRVFSSSRVASSVYMSFAWRESVSAGSVPVRMLMIDSCKVGDEACS